MRPWRMVLASLAGLFGASGVALAAAGAHVNGGPALTSAASFLLFHAGALVGFCAFGQTRTTRAVTIAAATIALGTVLFSGEIALHTLGGFSGFTKAAPIGGSLMILGWLVAAFALPVAVRRETGC